MTKHVPVIHSSEPTRPLTPRKPVDPVRRCCSQLRQPNPTTLKTAKSASAKSAAVVVRISGSPSVRSSGHEPLWRLAITAVSGRFCGGDVVELRAPDAAMVARGVVAYDASELATMVGRSTSELPGELRRPVVHADDLVAVSAKQAKQV